jgi:hypothetical protein
MEQKIAFMEVLVKSANNNYINPDITVKVVRIKKVCCLEKINNLSQTEKLGICAMCGVKILDTKMYRQSNK